MPGFGDQQGSEQVAKLDIAHFIHPTTSIGEHIKEGPAIVTGADGVYVDFSDGVRRLDCIAGLWLCNVGYGRKEIAEAAYQQMLELAYYPTFFSFTNRTTVALATKVCSLSPVNLNHVFFSLGGSEGNEIAFKIARQYFHALGKPDKNKILSRRLAYHGVTFGAISASGLPHMRKGVQPVIPGFLQVEAPYCFRCPFGQEYPQCNLACAEDLRRAIVREGADNVAAFIAEPVMGVGGTVIPPPGYFQRVRDICNEYNVLFIADEVITGFGRTGTMFGVEHWDVVPDIMVMAKGITSGYLPLGATVIGDHVFDALAAAPGAQVGGFTYSGHPTICAVALKNIDILESENLVSNSQTMGEYLKTSLEDLDNPYVGEVRGLGLMLGVEIVQDRAPLRRFPDEMDIAKRVERAAFMRGLLVRGLQKHVIVLSPPLTINEADVKFLVETLDVTIRETVDSLS